MNSDQHDRACPNCGAIRPAGLQFCSNCGYGSSPLVSRCRRCAAVLDPQVAVCPECGHPVRRGQIVWLWVTLLVVIGIPAALVGGCLLVVAPASQIGMGGVLGLMGLAGIALFVVLLVLTIRSARK